MFSAIIGHTATRYEVKSKFNPFQIGKTNMVKLKPEDFTGSVVNLSKNPTGSLETIREIKRMLNKNPEASDIGK